MDWQPTPMNYKNLNSEIETKVIVIVMFGLMLSYEL